MTGAAKRIVLVVNGLVRAGAEGQVVRLAEHLSANGHEVVVATLLEPEAHVERLRSAGVDVVVLGRRPVVAVVALVRLLAGSRADVVASFLYQSNLVALVAGALARTPRRVTSIRNERFGGRGRELLLRLLLPLGHVEVTNASLVAERLTARRVLRPGRVVVVPNAVDVGGDALTTSAADRAAIRLELGLGHDFTWVCVARLLTEQKGLDVLLRAFAGVAAGAHSPPRLLVVGTGADRAALEAEAAGLGWGSHITFLGQRDDVPRLLSAADGFVLASRWEGSPNSVLEALVAEVPVVATAVGGVVELLGDGADVVRPGDVAALARTMTAVQARPAEARAAAAAEARRRVEESHGATVVGAAWDRVLAPPVPVSLFLQRFASGGAQRVFLILAGQLPIYGMGVDLVVATGGGPLAGEVPTGPSGPAEQATQAPVLVDLGAHRTIAALPALVRHLRRRRPAALITTLDHASVLGVLAVALAGTRTPTVVRIANTTSVLAARARGRDRIVYIFARTAFRRASALIAPSAGAARDLERWLGAPFGKVTVVPNPVVGDDVARGLLEPVTHPWFADGEPPVLLAVCRLEPHKGLLGLLDAFAEVRVAVPSRLVILGEGSERAQLEARVAELGLAGAVELPGFDPNPFRYMGRAGAFVLASEVEGLPGALIQALACGCPVVSTDCPSGPREVLDGGRHGRLVPVGDISALRDALVDVLTAGRIAADPAAWAPYTWEVGTAAYLDVLAGIGVHVPAPRPLDLVEAGSGAVPR